METYVANLEEASGGRLVVSLHPIGAIAPTTEEMDAVSGGNELMARAFLKHILIEQSTSMEKPCVQKRRRESGFRR